MERYQLTRIYNDAYCFYEYSQTITSMLSAAAIYLEDPDCVFIMIVDTYTKQTIMNYKRE